MLVGRSVLCNKVPDVVWDSMTYKPPRLNVHDSEFFVWIVIRAICNGVEGVVVIAFYIVYSAKTADIFLYDGVRESSGMCSRHNDAWIFIVVPPEKCFEAL